MSQIRHSVKMSGMGKLMRVCDEGALGSWRAGAWLEVSGRVRQAVIEQSQKSKPWGNKIEAWTYEQDNGLCLHVVCSGAYLLLGHGMAYGYTVQADVIKQRRIEEQEELVEELQSRIALLRWEPGDTLWELFEGHEEAEEGAAGGEDGDGSGHGADGEAVCAVAVARRRKGRRGRQNHWRGDHLAELAACLLWVSEEHNAHQDDLRRLADELGRRQAWTVTKTLGSKRPPTKTTKTTKTTTKTTKTTYWRPESDPLPAHLARLGLTMMIKREREGEGRDGAVVGSVSVGNAPTREGV